MSEINKTLEDLELLKLKHAEWDRLLKEEQERPMPNSFNLQNYKRHKLELKQKIEEIEKLMFK